MKFLGLLAATLFVPILPWIILVGPWMAKEFNDVSLCVLAGSGVVLDLWWGTPMGLTALFLLGLTFAIRLVSSWWPADQRILFVVTVISSLIVAEVYLAVV
jgi:hypothetical protein